MGLSTAEPLQRQLDRGGSAPLSRCAQRAGPALPSYLALHHAGFSRLLVLLPGRWALTPPFHPCQTIQRCRGRAFARRYAKTSRRFPCAMPPCCSAGGIFSVALSVTEPHRAPTMSERHTIVHVT